MKKVIISFILSFGCSFFILYKAAGGILENQEKPPISIISSQSEDQPFLNPQVGNRKLPIYGYHKISGVSYYGYDKDSNRKNFKLFVKEVVPLKSGEISLTDPVCTYYPSISRTKAAYSPDQMTLRSRKGKLRIDPQSKKILFLKLSSQVSVKGFQKNNKKLVHTSTITSKKLTVDLQKKSLESDENVSFYQTNFSHQKIISLNATGIQGSSQLNQLKFMENVRLKIFSEFWENRHQKRGNISSIYSQSKGMAEISYEKEKSQIHIRQHKQVKIIANQAVLKCQILDMWFVKSEQKKYRLQKIQAQGDVVFQDGDGQSTNRLVGDKLVIDNIGANNFCLIVTGNPKITIEKLTAFSLLDDKSKVSLVKKQEKFKFKTLFGKCSKEIRWESDPKHPNQEKLTFFGDVVLHQQSKKIKFLELHCQKAILSLQKILRNGRQSRVANSLKAENKITIIHDRGYARGEKFQWHRIHATRYTLRLQGHPFVFIENIKSNGGEILEGASFGKQAGSKVKDRQKKSEDIAIQSLATMTVVAVKKEGKQTFGYHASDQVIVTRYFHHKHKSYRNQQKGNNRHKQKGKLSCQELTAFIAPIVKNGKRKQQIRFLHATGNLKFSGPEASGAGDKLYYVDTEKKYGMQLSGNAWTRTKQGKLSAKSMIYDARKQIFHAIGTPVSLDGKETGGFGQELWYFRKKDHLRLLGSPASLWQFNKQGKKKHLLRASSIQYWRKTGKFSAAHNVQLTISVTTKGLDLLGVHSEKREEGLPKQYFIRTENATAIFNSKKKELQTLKTEGKITITKIFDSQSSSKEEATGQRLEYNHQKANLYGKPAKICYGKNQIISDHFTLDKQQGKLTCHGPAKVVLYDIDKNFTTSKKKNNSHESPVTIQCQESIIFLQKQNQIHFKRDVRVTKDKANLSCYHMIIHLQKQRISSLVAYGQVMIRAQENIAIADQLRWNDKNELATLIGAPKVILKTKDFNMKTPIVWYNVKQRRFFTQGREVLIEHFPSQKNP